MTTTMRSPETRTPDRRAAAHPTGRGTPAGRGDHAMLADALDRVLHRGVTVDGNLTIGLADVDLLYLDLRLLLASVDTIFPDGRPPVAPISPRTPQSPDVPPSDPDAPQPPLRCRGGDAAADGSLPPPAAAGRDSCAAAGSWSLPEALAGGPADGATGPGAPQGPGNGLARLVLTLVRLIHDLLERQAVRRMAAGRLSDAQVEDLGLALMAQAREIDSLRRLLGLTDRDLTLDLGIPDGVL